MEEMNHFSHMDHPLKLIENWETVKGVRDGSDDEKPEVVQCYACQELISEGAAYGCIPCLYFLHKTCAQLEPTINHYLHFQHPLTLKDRGLKFSWFCDVCGHRDPKPIFSYNCSLCDFDACMTCGVVAFVAASAREKDIAALKEEASVKFEHEGHPQHSLTLQLRPAAFLCDACNTEDKDLFYRCDSCDFWIHKTCASLAPNMDLPHHRDHPLTLAYSLPKKFYNFKYFCEFCNKQMLQNDWMYHCANCRYFVHIKCALNAETPRDDPNTLYAKEPKNDDLQSFPMSHALTDPLKLHFEKKSLQHDEDATTNINHWCHRHSLILNVGPQGNNMPNISCNDPIIVCHGCVRPLSFPYYSCQGGCQFFLHKYCVELPRTLKHPIHPNHSLELIDHFHGSKKYKCNGCFKSGNTFAYKCETCCFTLDVNCAFLPNTIKHEFHKDPLIQTIDREHACNACNLWSDGICYSCKDCNFKLDLSCAVLSPRSLAHRYCKGHFVQLTYPPVANHPHDFYCDICEIEMHPRFWLYHCHGCDNSFHPYCIWRDDLYSNYKCEGIRSVYYHKHSLTHVRRKKTPRYVCSSCNLDINGHLILECHAKTCNFKICILCHVRKVRNLPSGNTPLLRA